MSRRHTCLALTIVASACAPYGQLRHAARTASWVELETLLHEGNRTGQLNFRAIRRTAQSLLEGEVERARGGQGAALVLGLAGCARPIESALQRRAETQDAPGGAALLLAVEIAPPKHELDAKDLDLTERHFRAAYAHTLATQPGLRRPFLKDVEPLVRRAALDAALLEHTAGDLGEMLAISRHDPDDLCRSKALRWLGAEPSPRALSALLDRFSEGDERQGLFALSGLQEQALSVRAAADALYHIALTSEGRVGLEAAFFFLRLPEAKAKSEETGAGLSLAEQKVRVRERLLDYAENGALDERMSVLSRLDESSDAWFRLLKKSTDPSYGRLAVVAWKELLGFEETRLAAQKQLFAYAAGEDDVALVARRVLAEQGYTALVPTLTRDLNHRDVMVRREAATNLLELGRPEAVAPLLADGNADLRVDVACQLLAL